MWQNNSHYNSPGGTVQSNTFTTPAGSGSFRFSYRVRLDQGWLAFSNLKLIGWSAVIPVTAASQYELSLNIAGQLPAPVGQGGRVWAHYNSGSPTLIWQNPANFNSGGLNHSQTFTPPAGANQVQFSYEVEMDKGRLAFSNPGLSRQQPAYTISRTVYSLAGQTIAVRVSGDLDETNNGLFYIYSDHLGRASVMSHSDGSKVAGSDAHYLPFGAYRGAAPTTNPSLTDIGYTGHKQAYYIRWSCFYIQRLK